MKMAQQSSSGGLGLRLTSVWGQKRDGFTLLEVMIALMILAMSLASISFANATAMHQVARITRMTQASFLLEGIVNDVHAHYVNEGFPTNDVEGKTCELPRDFDGLFECEFDIRAMDLTPEQMQTLISAGMEQFMGAMGGSEEGASGLTQNAGISGMDMSQLALLAPLFGPTGEELTNLCGINLGQVMMGITALSTYMPQIIGEITKRTRQFTIRLSWDDGPRKQREVTVQTYIVSLPEEEVQAMKTAEKARELQETVQTTAPQE